MLVSKNAKIYVTPDAKPKISITPNAKPQLQSVEYRLRWVPNTKFTRWPCTFHFFGVDFIRIESCFSVEYGLQSYFSLAFSISAPKKPFLFYGSRPMLAI